MLRTIALRLGRVQNAHGPRTNRTASFSISASSHLNEFYDGHQDASPPPPRRSAYAQRAERDAPSRPSWQGHQRSAGSPMGVRRTGFGLLKDGPSRVGESNSKPMNERGSRNLDDGSSRNVANGRRPSWAGANDSGYPTRSREMYNANPRTHNDERSGESVVQRDMIRDSDYGQRYRTAHSQDGQRESRQSEEPLRMSILSHRDEASTSSAPLPPVETVNPADEASSSTAIATTSQSQISSEYGELDAFFAGHNEAVDEPKIEDSGTPAPPAKPFAPSALASYIPPRESGVALIKKYFLEHKFLTTQEIWKMGTSHLKPPLRETHAILPNGRIRMKRVSTMREGRRPWVPPMEASFPEHPFRSVRSVHFLCATNYQAD